MSSRSMAKALYRQRAPELDVLCQIAGLQSHRVNSCRKREKPNCTETANESKCRISVLKASAWSMPTCEAAEP
jgi:hypothetical protein